MTFPGSADLNIIVEVYLGADPTDFPQDWPAPTNFSDRLLRQPIQIRRGRGQNQKTASAGSCTLWLDNTDGALTPFLATSNYYPEWDLGVPIRVSVTDVGTTPPYVRHAGFVADIEAVMVPGTGGKNISAVKVTSAGVLRRISQGAVVKSGLRRRIQATEPYSYWALDDGPLSVAGVLTEGIGGPFQASLWNGGTVNPGSAQLPSWLGTGLELDGAPEIVVAEATYNTALAPSSRLVLDATLLVNFGTADASPEGQVTSFGILDRHTNATLTSTRTQCWIMQLDFDNIAGTIAPVLYAAFGGGATVFTASSGAIAGFDETVPHHIRIDLTQTGADIAAVGYLDGVAFGSGTLAGYTLTSFNLSVVRLTHYEASDPSSSVVYTDIAVWVDADPPGVVNTADGALGFAGELAHDRIDRNCSEEGIPYSGTATVSNECGPQPVADIVGVLQDTEEIDHGMLVEDFGWGLDYRASSQRINLEPVITVDLSTYRTTAGTQADVLTPVRNDARMRNEWTITRESGSSATASDPVHIAKRGRYDDSATVNVENDSRLLHEAQWRVHEGTFEGLRYQTIPLDLAANLDD